MTNDEARKILERNKSAMSARKKMNETAEKSLNEAATERILNSEEADKESILLGPKNELAFRRILKDIKESGNGS